jgi:hypothetical protein
LKFRTDSSPMKAAAVLAVMCLHTAGVAGSNPAPPTRYRPIFTLCIYTLCKNECNRSMYERHGASKTRLYKIWCGMRNRCYLPSHDAFAYYGGRGVKVCEEWLDSFTAFRRWALEHGYRSDKSIDRFPDRDGNYEPGNCRWATGKAQARNKGPAKSHVIVEHNGVVANLSEWSRRTSIGYSTLMQRYRAGKRGEYLFAIPHERLLQIGLARSETRNGKAKLTDEVVAAIRESEKSGSDLAKDHKVSEALVSMIRSGQRR